MFDLVIRGGELVDGTGSRRHPVDVGVRDGRVAAIGDLSVAAGAQTIDAAGRIVAPGFVDLHTHSDYTIISDPRAQSAVRQGTTTHVIGNCGMSPSPAPAARAAEVRAAVNVVDPDPAVRVTWSDLPGYAAAVESVRPALNVAPLVGHVTLRVAAEGNTAGPATPEGRAEMVRLLEAALEAGAPGLSTGLMYPPAMYADRAELEALGRAVAARDRLFAVHMRNYNDHLLEAVDEAIDVARATGCRLQLSHMAVAGRRNWGKVPQALERIDAARRDGLDVATDIYPYVAGSANLSQLLPDWAQAGGTDTIVARLSSREDRRRIVAEWRESLFFGWDEVEIALVDPGMEADLGRTVAAAAETRGTDPSEAALDLIRDTENRVIMVAYGRSEDDLRAVLRHAATSIGSDGLAMDPNGPSGAGRPHPRSFGCYPRFLGRYVRDEGLIDLETAIAMCTSRPADRAGLRDRGRIVEGAAADIVVFDAATIVDRATFREPHQFPVGIEAVVVNGALVVEGDVQHADRRNGHVLEARSPRA
ncbi:MAG TPA: D-aminoacylase [Candidatus Saccharimonadales bacterium]|nr:D-aminoacylase [Candidatus Saccharimonadales bacterium]